MTRAILLIVTLAGVFEEAARADIPLNDDEVKCVLDLNKRGAKVAAAQNKQNRFCIKEAGKGSIPAENACLDGDAKGKIEQARGKTTDAFGKSCSDVPDLGPTSDTAVNDAFEDHSRTLAGEIFGDLATGVILKENDQDGAKCQDKLIQNAGKIFNSKMKAYLACKKEAGNSGIGSAAALEACVTPAGITADAKGKIAKAVSKLGADIADKCAAAVDPLLAGECADATGDPLRDCIDALVECRVCLAINAADNLNVDCSAFSGITCPPTAGLTCGDGEWQSPQEECDTAGTAVQPLCPGFCQDDCTCSDACTTNYVWQMACTIGSNTQTIGLSCQTLAGCQADASSCAMNPSCVDAANDVCQQMGCAGFCVSQCALTSSCCP